MYMPMVLMHRVGTLFKVDGQCYDGIVCFLHLCWKLLPCAAALKDCPTMWMADVKFEKSAVCLMLHCKCVKLSVDD
jgi:hypothetical protein